MGIRKDSEVRVLTNTAPGRFFFNGTDRPCFFCGGVVMMMIFFFPMVFCFCLKTAGFVDLFNFRMLGRCFRPSVDSWAGYTSVEFCGFVLVRDP